MTSFREAPRALLLPFAAEGSKSNIPDKKTTTGDGYAAYDTGFPPETQKPIGSGGIPPRRPDMNGILNDLSRLQFFLSNGPVFWPFSNVIAANGGYPLGALIRPDLNSDGRILMAGQNNTTSNFNLYPAKIGTEWFRWNGIPDYCPGINHYEGEFVIWADDLNCYRCKRPNGPGYGGVKNPSDTNYWISLPDWIAEQLKYKGGIPKWSEEDCYSPLPHIVWGSDLMLYIAENPSGPCVIGVGPKDPTTTTGYWISLPDWVKRHIGTGSEGDGSGGDGSGENGGSGVIVTGPGARLFVSQTSGEWVVPAGVYSILITLTGGGGGGWIEFGDSGSTYGQPFFYGGAAGSTCIGSKEVTPGETISFIVGAGGESVSRYLCPGHNIFGGGEVTGGGGLGGNSICLGMTALGGGQSGDNEGGQISFRGSTGDKTTSFVAGGGGSSGVSYWPGMPSWPGGWPHPPVFLPDADVIYGYEWTAPPGTGGMTFCPGQNGIIVIQC